MPHFIGGSRWKGKIIHWSAWISGLVDSVELRSATTPYIGAQPKNTFRVQPYTPKRHRVKTVREVLYSTCLVCESPMKIMALFICGAGCPGVLTVEWSQKIRVRKGTAEISLECYYDNFHDHLLFILLFLKNVVVTEDLSVFLLARFHICRPSFGIFQKSNKRRRARPTAFRHSWSRAGDLRPFIRVINLPKTVPYLVFIFPQTSLRKQVQENAHHERSLSRYVPKRLLTKKIKTEQR